LIWKRANGQTPDGFEFFGSENDEFFGQTAMMRW
jgi:hypothetical protein